MVYPMYPVLYASVDTPGTVFPLRRRETSGEGEVEICRPVNSSTRSRRGLSRVEWMNKALGVLKSAVFGKKRECVLRRQQTLLLDLGQ